MSFDIYLIVSIVWVSMISLTALIPFLSRRSISFGIAIPVEQYKAVEVTKLQRAYSIWSVVAGILLGSGSIVGMSARRGTAQDVWLILPLLVYLLATIGLYVGFHLKMKRLKAREGWKLPETRFVAVDTSFRRRRLILGAGWYLIPLGLIAVNIVLVALYYDQIPDVLDVHYNTAGEVNRRVAKSVWQVFSLNGIQLLLAGVLLLASRGVAASKQELNPADPQGSRERNVAYRWNTSIFLLVLSILITLLFAVVQMGIIGFASQQIIMGACIGMIVLVLAGSILFAVITMKKGIKEPISGGSAHDDRYWKGGMIYYNPDDPALMVEKRMGGGWTVNFGRPVSWLLLLVPLAIAAIVIGISIFGQ